MTNYIYLTIAITGFQFTDTSLIVKITGVAESRQILLDLQDQLKNAKFITSVDIPLSSYDKKTDVPFQVNLTLAFTELPQYDSS